MLIDSLTVIVTVGFLVALYCCGIPAWGRFVERYKVRWNRSQRGSDTEQN